MDNIRLIDSSFIELNTDFNQLINALKQGFSSRNTIVPMRHHHDFPNPKVDVDSTLLLMPAWNPSQDAGIKVVSVSPENSQFDLPSIQGTYIYLDATKGTIKAILEAKSLTAKRTAAASALASSFLSRKDSNSLLMIGTGVLSDNLIKAHASVRPIENVFVWGRNLNKVKAVCRSLKSEPYTVKAIEAIEEKISEVDIISCATLSKNPLVLGKFLVEGQHIDLVGSYKKEMREADNDAIAKASVFVDTYEGSHESGDIVIPLEEGIITKGALKADLFELCSNQKKGRIFDGEITVFKSVGYALEDLVAAKYYYEQL